MSRIKWQHSHTTLTLHMIWTGVATLFAILVLTHWGRVTHRCVSKLTIIDSDNGLSPGRRQAIIWTNAAILLIGPLGTNFSEIFIEIITFSFKKMRLKVYSAKRRPFCLGLNVLTQPSHRDTVANSVWLLWLVVLDLIIERGISVIIYHSNNTSELIVFREDCDWYKDIFQWLNMNMLNISNAISHIGLSLRCMAAVRSRGGVGGVVDGGCIGVGWWLGGWGWGVAFITHSPAIFRDISSVRTIQGMGLANGRRCYNVTPSLIGRARTRKAPSVGHFQWRHLVDKYLRNQWSPENG